MSYYTREFLHEIFKTNLYSYGNYLSTKLLKIDDIRETAKFLIDFMPIMFIPAAVAIMDSWIELSPALHAVIWITVLTTIIVMVLSGHVTQFVIKKKGE